MKDVVNNTQRSIVRLLKACATRKDLDKGSKLHVHIRKHKSLQENCYIASSLVSMYARCGALAMAQQVLSELPARNAVTWNALITGYVQQGRGEEALKCFESMQREGYSPDAVTFVCILKACGSIGASDKGKYIHEKIVSSGMFEKDIMLGNILIDMYARCGALPRAQEVLDELPMRDVISWNALIGGFAQQGQGEEALQCFDAMQCEGHSPHAVTYICALKACGTIRASHKGEEIHDKIVSSGLLEIDIVLGNTLVDMYVKCGALAKAQQVLEELPIHDVITWNALIGGYAQQGRGKEALKCFDSMQRKGILPDTITFMFALKACGNIGAFIKGKQIHEKIMTLGLLEKDVMLGTTLVDMYARCGALAKAQEVLNKLSSRNMVTWNALIGGYVQQGQNEEALKCFESMQRQGYSPDGVSFICALKACGSVGATAVGEQIHEQIISLGLLESGAVLGNTLLDMYIKCAAFKKAEEVLDQLPVQNVITWNSLIGGYAQRGLSEEAFNCLKRMQSKGVKPESTTLVCVLNACSHSGLLDMAEMYFLRMSTKYGITPDIEHYCCMVDLFSRAGELAGALIVIEKMSSPDYLPIWAALMNACCNWADVKIGKLVFDHALQLNKNHAPSYVCMANIYITAGMQEDVDKIEVMRVANDATEMFGSSWQTDVF